MSTVEDIWVAARDRHGRRVRRSIDITGVAAVRDRRTPSPGITAVLFALADHTDAAHGSEVARRAGQDQGNVVGRWLPRLAEWRFVELVDQIPAARVKADRRGGRPAKTWRLTPAGRDLVVALRAELGHEAVTP